MGSVYLAVAIEAGWHNWRGASNPGPREVYKIGFSQNPPRRVEALRFEFGGKWMLVDQFPGSLKLEHAIHKALRHLHSPFSPPRFREYYRRSPAVRHFFNHMKDRHA